MCIVNIWHFLRCCWEGSKQIYNLKYEIKPNAIGCSFLFSQPDDNERARLSSALWIDGRTHFDCGAAGSGIEDPKITTGAERLLV